MLRCLFLFGIEQLCGNDLMVWVVIAFLLGCVVSSAMVPLLGFWIVVCRGGA